MSELRSCQGGGTSRMSPARLGRSYGHFSSRKWAILHVRQRPCSEVESDLKKAVLSVAISLRCRPSWVRTLALLFISKFLNLSYFTYLGLYLFSSSSPYNEDVVFLLLSWLFFPFRLGCRFISLSLKIQLHSILSALPARRGALLCQILY